MKTTKVFCLPYAGGSAAIYNKWNHYTGHTTTFRPIELAGRGVRINEPFYKNIEEAADDILNAIRAEIKEGPYAFFGHSMGALLTYVLAQKIEESNLPKPQHLFFSGRRAPDVVTKEKYKYHKLDEAAFKAKVLELGGTPREFFDHPELLELFLPLLRSDFKLAAVDFSQRTIKPFNCAISVLLGEDDDLVSGDVDSWKKHSENCKTYYFEGGHFFLNNKAPKIVALIERTLSQVSK